MDMTMHRMLTRSSLVLLIAAALAGCGGGGGDGDGVATLGDGGTTTTADAGSGADLTDAEREDAMLEFTECMRDHGVDMPDPTSAGPGGGGGKIAIGGDGPDQDGFEAAQEACGDILGDAFGERQAPSAEEQAQMQDDMLAFAKCMREHGVDMPDPDFSSGNGGVIMRPGEGTDPGEDPDFEAAQTACQDELGFEGGNGPGLRIEGGGPSRSGSASAGDA
jgi:hypothetical protein